MNEIHQLDYPIMSPLNPVRFTSLNTTPSAHYPLPTHRLRREPRLKRSDSQIGSIVCYQVELLDGVNGHLLLSVLRMSELSQKKSGPSLTIKALN